MVTLNLDYSNILRDNIGDTGLDEADISGLSSRVKEAIEALQTRRNNGELMFLELPFWRDPVEKITAWANKAREEYDTFLVLGIGGSGLGTKALEAGLLHPYHNWLPETERKGMRLFVADNVDPNGFGGLLDVLDLKRTLVNVVSKSGATSEVLAQFMVIKKLLTDKLGEKAAKERIIVTTDPKRGFLRKLADEEGYTSFEVPEGVGGRYSVLSPVGLVPAAAAGIDINALIEGAAEMGGFAHYEDVMEVPAALFATLAYLADFKLKRNILVLWPYADGLKKFAEWFQQLWAESLGKANSLDGSKVNVGTTPVTALGATDQHSQLQLYMEGPPDKMVTFFGVKDKGRDIEIPREFETSHEAGFLGGHTLNKLIESERAATASALAKASRPNITIEIERLDEAHLGAIMYMMEVAAAIAGYLYNVNPFDQPGVEHGKKLTHAMLGKSGMEKPDIEPKIKRRI